MNKLRNLLLLMFVVGAFGAGGVILYAQVGNYSGKLIYAIFLAAPIASVLVTFAFKVKDAIKALPFGGVRGAHVRSVAHRMMVRLWVIACFMLASGVIAVLTKFACEGSSASAAMWATIVAFVLVCTSSFYGVLVPLRVFFDLHKFEAAIEEHQRRHAMLERLNKHAA